MNDTCEQCGGEASRHGVCSDCIGVPPVNDMAAALVVLGGAIEDWTDVAGSLCDTLRGGF